MAPAPHPSNAPGDFYVEEGCCMSCAMPFSEAPDLFKWDGHHHCYVHKQPTTEAETERMLNAMGVSEVDCIRYRGHERVIQIRLVETKQGALCDSLPPDLEMRSEGFRNHQAHLDLLARGPSPLQRLMRWIWKRP
jgi:hypothetical protein